MSTIMEEGSFGSMVHGTVTRAWAWTFHRKWYDRIKELVLLATYQVIPPPCISPHLSRERAGFGVSLRRRRLALLRTGRCVSAKPLFGNRPALGEFVGDSMRVVLGAQELDLAFFRPHFSRFLTMAAKSRLSRFPESPPNWPGRNPAIRSRLSGNFGAAIPASR